MNEKTCPRLRGPPPLSLHPIHSKLANVVFGMKIQIQLLHFLECCLKLREMVPQAGHLGARRGAIHTCQSYLSFVAIGAEAGTEAGAGAGAGAGVGTAMAGSSSEAGLSLTLSWGAGAENRPDTLKLMSADRREQVLASRASTGLCLAARARTTFPFP